MKYILKLLLKLVILLLIFSCSEEGTKSLFDTIATTNEEPSDPEKPVVKSFEVKDSVVIEWEKDKGADEYILYRAFNDPHLSYSKIYEGSKLSYTDYVGEYDVGVFFYYKIAKKRENKEFKKSEYSVGVVSDITKGFYEDNNSYEEAANINSLGDDSIRIYYARDDWGNQIEDIDYYRVKIPEYRYYTYQVIFDGEKKLKDNDIKVYNGDVYTSITDGQEFNVYNRDKDDEKYITFFICVDKSNFLQAGDPNFPLNTNGRGFKYGSYRLYYRNSYPINE